MFGKLYAIALAILIVLDLTWLTTLAKNIYQQQIGFLMKPQITWWPVALFYPLFALGLVLFVIAPAVEKKSLAQALLLGALFGLIAYAAYDLTNIATLKGWPLPITIIDLLWGTTLSAVTCGLTYLISTARI